RKLFVPGPFADLLAQQGEDIGVLLALAADPGQRKPPRASWWSCGCQDPVKALDLVVRCEKCHEPFRRLERRKRGKNICIDANNRDREKPTFASMQMNGAHGELHTDGNGRDEAQRTFASMQRQPNPARSGRVKGWELD